jgi:hypothetical protein
LLAIIDWLTAFLDYKKRPLPYFRRVETNLDTFKKFSISITLGCRDLNNNNNNNVYFKSLNYTNVLFKLEMNEMHNKIKYFELLDEKVFDLCTHLKLILTITRS